ncbi:MAG: hypothetical protein UZ18_ATM001000542 [Armatimonadetes bacterium OLB18]|nr:MAG: hypothetical protein UZ18_ATM001000542 [Armatimonadetes bacterium OLB18]
MASAADLGLRKQERRAPPLGSAPPCFWCYRVAVRMVNTDEEP